MLTPRFSDGHAMQLVGIRRTHQFADVARDIGGQWAEFAAATAPFTSAADVNYGVVCAVDMTA